MNKQHAGVLLGGILLLIIAMGIGRFAFTPILPFMRIDEHLTFEAGGWLASSNYIGYFIGAMGAGFILRHKKNILLLNVLLCVTSIVWMGFTHLYFLWFLLRLVAGITGGFIFVLTSSIIMDYLAEKNLSKWSGYVFCGIGIGITISGLFVPYFEARVQWEGTWIGIGILSLLLFLTTMVLWKRVIIRDTERVEKTADTNVWRGIMPWLIFAYALEGFGYIITGTFIVDIVYNIENLRPFASYTWVVVGLAAAPAAPFWMAMMSRIHPIHCLFITYVLQVIGIALPVVSQTAWSVMLCAALYGFTFVGMVTLATGYGRQLYPKQSGLIVSLLTSFYAFGQIIGPIFASKLEHHFQTFKAPLLLASGSVFCGLLILIVGHYTFTHQKKTESIT